MPLSIHPAPCAQSLRRRHLLQAVSAATLLTLPATRALAATFPSSLPGGARVAEGHVLQYLLAWGDPVSDGPAWRPDAGNPPGEQAVQAGMRHAGLAFLAARAEDGDPALAGLLCINHADADDRRLHGDGGDAWSHARTVKAQNAHGLSVVALTRAGAEGWAVLRPSAHGRRITARTPVRLSGPAAGAPELRTRDDRRGHVVFGTLANRTMATTPWATCLSGEGDFSPYFNGPSSLSAEQRGDGIRPGGAGRRWHEYDSRFDVATEPNEANRFGWVLEVDPRQPARPPVKRTALGRFRHGGLCVRQAGDGRVVVYLCDDSAGGALYKFVSHAAYRPDAPASAGDPLDAGVLYAAHLSTGGQGEWRALVHGQSGLDAAAGFTDQASVLIRARRAAERVGATPFEHPRALAALTQEGEMLCLHGTTGRALHWRENGDAAALRFEWREQSVCDPACVPLGEIVAAPGGGLWLLQQPQDDASGGRLLFSQQPGGTPRLLLEAPPGFVVGGVAPTGDGRALFINLRQTGTVDDFTPPWPGSQFAQATGGRQRSATVVLVRSDGRPLGE